MALTEETGRNAPKKRLLRAVAAQAAVLTGAVHLLWAWPRLGASDPRPYVFVLVGLFVVLIAAATLKADEYRRIYALGAGTLGTLLVGYLGWYGASTPAVLATDPLAIVAKIAEVVGIVAFAALYKLSPPTAVVIERRKQRGETVFMPDPVKEARKANSNGDAHEAEPEDGENRDGDDGADRNGKGSRDGGSKP
ncbi:hypothetical protein [Halorubrum vacuolatum]|uniref:Uncharacterized protein n=1 Tax=Halorubrum vacuolatum TaxID=63740 RepID=A0A238XKH0_HALVU|nr:hypothetical protein [Halorubrum vacuolatum]SNR58469.1 hypothetical protein SAMN06264855_11822 [Halorubrum vacuolatum]